MACLRTVPTVPDVRHVLLPPAAAVPNRRRVLRKAVLTVPSVFLLCLRSALRNVRTRSCESNVAPDVLKDARCTSRERTLPLFGHQPRSMTSASKDDLRLVRLSLAGLASQYHRHQTGEPMVESHQMAKV